MRIQIKPVSFFTRANLLVSVFITLFAVFGMSSFNCKADPVFAEFLRPESYILEFHSGRGNERPKLSGNWAIGKHQDGSFKVIVPSRFVAAKKMLVNYRWSVGSQWAGLSERVELHWRKEGQAWNVSTLGEGFRDPQSGQLLLFPAQISLGDEQPGQLEFKFMLVLQNGSVIQDGGDNTVFSVFVMPAPVSGRIDFRADWSHSISGRLAEGRSFELRYSVERLVSQINLHGGEPCPWSMIAHVQFDDGPVEEYPVVVVFYGQPNRVLAFAPTIVVPENARRMSMWFLAFYDSRSYFDSNFGRNFNFDILNEQGSR
ncbi:MAG: DUF6209 family protein [Silvanigrellaceae bacterium]